MKQLLLIWPTLLAAAGREAGAVKQTDGAAYFVNAYPVVPRLASGKLLVVWSATAKTEKAARVVAALSTDGARSWSAPQSLIQTAGMSDLDPNILVDGKRVFVYSTTVAVNMTRIDRSQVYMTQSDDEGASWSKPVEIAMPFKYFVGKRHREFFANRDVRGFLFPFRATNWQTTCLRRASFRTRRSNSAPFMSYVRTVLSEHQSASTS